MGARERWEALKTEATPYRALAAWVFIAAFGLLVVYGLGRLFGAW